MTVEANHNAASKTNRTVVRGEVRGDNIVMPNEPAATVLDRLVSNMLGGLVQAPRPAIPTPGTIDPDEQSTDVAVARDSSDEDLAALVAIVAAAQFAAPNVPQSPMRSLGDWGNPPTTFAADNVARRNNL